MNPALLAPVFIAIALGALVISTQSFWMDEAITGIMALQPTPAAWWNAMRLCPDANQQMPGYMAYMWVWAKIFGGSEWFFRAANLPWLALGLLAIPRRQTLFKAIFLASPFIWFYLDQARPYAMQFSAGLLLFGCAGRLQSAVPADEKKLAAAYAFGLVLLAGSTILGMIWAGAYLAATILFWGHEKSVRLLRENRSTALGAGIFLAAFASYYLWRVLCGNRCAQRETGADTAAFVIYELLGFTGLGPGQVAYRSQGLRAFLPFVPWLALYAVTTATVIWFGAKKMLQALPRRVWLGVMIAFAAVVLILIPVAVLNHVRLMGRYFAPLVPLLLLLLATGFGELWLRGKIWRILAVVFISLQLASAVSLRFCDRHAKEDYREAAAAARKALALGQRVWWCADVNGGAIYQVPLTPIGSLPVTNQAWLAFVFPEAVITNQPLPDLVVLSRPLNYDPNGYVRAMLDRQHYQVSSTLQAFTLWQPARTNQPVQK